uniref:Ovule protein n=1 Tax=Bursaphelenchus xylophilus TaxID=6326 RepID=A0A1I7RS59_BURXY
MTLSFKEGTKRFMVDSLQGRLSRKRKKLKQLAECSSLGNHAGLRANNVCNLGSETLSPFSEFQSSTQFPVVSDRLVICLP